MRRDCFCLMMIVGIVLASSGPALAAPPTDELPQSPPFVGLKTYTVEHNKACGPQPVRKISLNPEISKIVKRVGEEVSEVSTKIHRRANDTYLIAYDPGPSCDPSFTITSERDGSVVGIIDSDHIIIPGNGYIYSIARSNAHFSIRQKLTIENRALKEIHQPFLSVDLDTTVKTDLAIYSAKEGGHVTANIPKGSKVRVLINSGEYYLIQTAFGLVGWARLTPGKRDASAIDGIFYMGD